MTVTRAGEPVTLTVTEFRLFSLLLDQRVIALSSEYVRDEVWTVPSRPPTTSSTSGSAPNLAHTSSRQCAAPATGSRTPDEHQIPVTLALQFN